MLEQSLNSVVCHSVSPHRSYASPFHLRRLSGVGGIRTSTVRPGDFPSNLIGNDATDFLHTQYPQNTTASAQCHQTFISRDVGELEL